MTKQAADVQPVDINAIIEKCLSTISNEIDNHKISLSLELCDGLEMVLADHIQIEQVFYNLVQNAIDAMGNVPENQRQLVIKTKQQSGEVVEIAVCDSGTGLSEEVSEKLFDSFFTTKEEGLGIGLSISRSIVESHNGRLLARLDQKRGATFIIELPVSS